MIQRKTILMILALAAALLAVTGCTKPVPYSSHQYTLEYPPPAAPQGPKLPAALDLPLFTAAIEFSDTLMIYRSAPYTRNSYNYAGWIAPPPNMVHDYLARDLAATGIFGSVMPEEEGPTGRFRLLCNIEEFLQDEVNGNNARMKLLVTLLDIEAVELPRKVMFQRIYEQSEPVTAKDAAAFAQGMSKAMGRVSARVIDDIYQAASARLAEKAAQKPGR